VHEEALTRFRLREPFDHGSRSTGLVADLRAAVPSDGPLSVLDLGAGLGSNFRYLAPRLGGLQAWHLYERRVELLRELPDELGRWAAERSLLNQRTGSSLVLGSWRVQWSLLGPVLPETTADAVVAHGFLDDLGWDGLQDFAEWLTTRRVPFLASANADGRVRLSPGHPFDEVVLEREGTGGDAVEAFAGLLEGYDVRVESTDWNVGSDRPDMAQAVVAEIARLSSHRHEALGWQAERFDQIEQGRLELRIGQQDLLARPRTRPWMG
jgi:hypothetical protein